MEAINSYILYTVLPTLKITAMKPIKRLFLVIPLILLFITLSLTIVIPVIYWVFTGEDWIELKYKIYELSD